ncbi:MAG: hypothetical protein WBM32_00475 [Crocosphaera sp.]|jgi:predicted ribosome-associated RNA-binding protein Tma20
MELIELFPIRKKQRQKLRRSYQFLQQEVEKFGKVYEQKSYEEILYSEAKTVIVKSEKGEISCSIEAYHIQKNGTIAVSIDADGLPTIFGIKPSYHFYKRPDGLVYY